MSADATQPPTKGEPLAAITRPYGALKDLDAGTLLIVEQPFANIDNRVISEECSHSINYWIFRSQNE